MQLKNYPEYKESGIQWIGEIPEGWEVSRVKHICSKSAEYGLNVPSDNYVDEGVRFLRTTDITENERLIENGVYLPENRINKEYLLDAGDVLVARSGSIGTSLYFDKRKYGKCSFAGYLVRFVVNNLNNGRFLYYFTKSKTFYAQIESQSIQTTIENFNAQRYANMQISVPPLSDQITIASFLDKQTARIDALIEKDKKLIALLKEKRTALINHAVTKGLDPNVKLKDSVVDWIGEVPEGWSIRKLSHISDRISVGFVGTIEKYYTDEDEGIPLLKTGNVGFGKLRLDDLSYVTKEFHILDKKSQLKPGDIVIARHGESGRSSVIPNNLKESNCLNIVLLKTGKGMSGAYHTYLLNSQLVQEHLQAIQGGAVQGVINTEDIAYLRFHHPPLSEQLQIVDYLDKATSKIDKTIKLIEKKIKLLQEYKKSLIYQVVTGKMDVRGVEA